MPPLPQRSGQDPLTLSGWPLVQSPRNMSPRPGRPVPEGPPTATAFIKDVQGRLVYCDASLTEFFRVSGVAWQGKADAELWPEELVGQIREQDRRILESGQPNVVEETVQHPDGEHRWLVFKFPFTGADGAVYLAGMSLDVSEQMRARQALEESEAHFRTLFESAAVGLAQIGPEQRFERINQPLCRLLGYEHDQLVDLAWKAVAHPDDIPACDAAYAAAVADGRSGFQMVYRFVRRDGRVMWADVSLAIVRAEDGQVRYCIVAIQDITAARAAAEELARHRDRLEEIVAERTEALLRSQDQLRHADRLVSIGTLAAGLAHEINNPIGAVSLRAESLMLSLRDGVEPAVVERTLRDIVDLAQRCGRIVRSVLTFAGQDAGRRVETSLATVVSNALVLTRPHVTRCGVHLDCQVAPDLPSLSLDETAMEQVLVNLLRNALDADARHVRIDVRPVGGEIVLVVADDGDGMTAEVRERMFDPFFTTRRERGGTGLGLSITHGIVREHGGGIVVESAPGAGCRIELRLPIPPLGG